MTIAQLLMLALRSRRHLSPEPEPSRGGRDFASAVAAGMTLRFLNEIGEDVADSVRVAATDHARRRGLLDRESLPANEGLLLSPGGSIHTFGMRFAIDVLFLDQDVQILKCVRFLQPWRIAFAPPGTRYVLEIAEGTAALDNIQLGEKLLWLIQGR